MISIPCKNRYFFINKSYSQPYAYSFKLKGFKFIFPILK